MHVHGDLVYMHQDYTLVTEDATAMLAKLTLKFRADRMDSFIG